MMYHKSLIAMEKKVSFLCWLYIIEEVVMKAVLSNSSNICRHVDSSTQRRISSLSLGPS